MPSEITFPSPSGYTETPWTDPNGKQWIADSKGRWSAYKADTGGGSGAWDDITGKPAAITALTGTNTGDETTSTIKTKLGISTLSGSNTGDQDISGLLTISSAASTYAPISTTVTLAGTQTLTNKSISAGQITGLGALATSTDAANLTGNIARARIDNALSANAAPIVATTVTASGAATVTGGVLTTNGMSVGSGASSTAIGQFTVFNSGTQRISANTAGIELFNTGNIGFSSTTSSQGAKDVNVSRVSAGLIGIGSGATGSTAGSLSLTNLTASGTVTASGAVSSLRNNSATYGDVNGVAFTSGFGVVRYTGGGTNRFYFGSSDDTTLRRSSAGVLDIDSGTNDAFRDLRLRNLTASGTVTGGNFKRGTGSPESVVSGSVGDLYTRTDGGAGTTLYVKESGTGNTGWVAK